MSELIYRWKSAMLFAAVACVFTGCSGKNAVAPIDVERQAFENLRSEIREVIDDPAREAEAIALVNWLVDDLDSLREKISARRKRARQLNADYDTSRADFQAFFDQVDKEIQSNKRQVSVRQRELFAITTPNERSTISKVHTKAMDAATRNIQAI